MGKKRKAVRLSAGEMELMNMLWQEGPVTIAESNTGKEVHIYRSLIRVAVRGPPDPAPRWTAGLTVRRSPLDLRSFVSTGVGRPRRAGITSESQFLDFASPHHGSERQARRGRPAARRRKWRIPSPSVIDLANSFAILSLHGEYIRYSSPLRCRKWEPFHASSTFVAAHGSRAANPSHTLGTRALDGASNPRSTRRCS